MLVTDIIIIYIVQYFCLMNNSHEIVQIGYHEIVQYNKTCCKTYLNYINFFEVYLLRLLY